MKYLKNYKTFESDHSDYLYIEKELGSSDPDFIYNNIKSLKIDKENSKIYKIVKDLFPDKSVQEIFLYCMLFFRLNYNNILNNYKKDVSGKNINYEKKFKSVYLLDPDSNTEIKVPARIGHKYIPVEILPFDLLHTKYANHRRLQVFHHKGLKCVSCPVEGKYLIKAKGRFGDIHTDLYSKDFKLMTIDHIKPKSKGGSSELKNLEPMCSNCNRIKSNFFIEPEN
jgi:hypothetical protein